MSEPVPQMPFDFTAAQLLERLRQRLDLPSHWRRIGKEGPVALYGSGDYRLSLTLQPGTRKVTQIVIVSAPILASPEIPAEMALTGMLLTEVVSEISPDSQDKATLLRALLNEGNADTTRIYDGVCYASRLEEGRLIFTAEREQVAIAS